MSATLHPKTDLTGYDETPDSVAQHFEILRGMKGGIPCPEGIEFNDQIRQVTVYRAWFDPRTDPQTEVRLTHNEIPPEITYIPTGGTEEITHTPSVVWKSEINTVEKTAADSARAQSEADRQEFLNDTAYRRDRKQDYAAELSPEGQLIESIGDVLDSLLEQVATLAGENTTAKFQSVLDKVSEIKARHPKPT